MSKKLFLVQIHVSKLLQSLAMIGTGKLVQYKKVFSQVKLARVLGGPSDEFSKFLVGRVLCYPCRACSARQMLRVTANRRLPIYDTASKLVPCANKYWTYYIPARFDGLWK